MLVPNKIYCLIFFVNTFTGDIFNTSIIKLSYKPYPPLLLLPTVLGPMDVCIDTVAYDVLIILGRLIRQQTLGPIYSLYYGSTV